MQPRQGPQKAPQNVQCPACGAPRSLDNPGLVMFVCEHCRSVVYWDAEKVQAAGQKSLLSEGSSRLYLGATGSFHSKRLRVTGRVRYSFGQGFWDEWLIETDDETLTWITEDQHELAVQQQVQLDQAIAFERCRPGLVFHQRGTPFMVQEVGHAECVGLEGALPKVLRLGETYPYVDASSFDGRYALGLEFDDDPPTAFLGRWLGHKELELDDEGEQW